MRALSNWSSLVDSKKYDLTSQRIIYTYLVISDLSWLKYRHIQFKHLKLTLLLVLLSIQLTACLGDGEYKKTPMSKKIDISQPNVKTELLVHIREQNDYSFSLIFKYENKVEGKRVFALTHGEDAYGQSTGGEITPIGIDVYTIKDGQEILVSIGGGELFNTNASSYGFKKLVYTDYLMPGKYRVVAETKQGNPKFKDVDVELLISLGYKPK